MESLNTKELIDVMLKEQISYQEKIDLLLVKILNKESHLSYSALSAFRKSPKDFIAYKFEDRASTRAMDFGTLVHCLVLEPEKFEHRYVAVPDDAPKKPTSAQINAKKPSEDTVKQIAWWNDFNENNKGKTIVNASEMIEAHRVAGNINNNYVARRILERCTQFERGIEFEYNNFLFRGFIDGDGERCRADLKIVADANPRKFQRTAIDMGYHLQGAVYDIGAGSVPFYIIAADRKGGVSVHKMSLDLLEYGKKQLDETLEAFNRCILENKWNNSYEFYSLRGDGSFDFDRPGYTY